MKFLYVPVMFAAILSIVSCKKDKVENPVLEIPITSVSFAIKDIDLSQRQDWLLYGGSQKYSFEIADDSLHAVPEEAPYILRYQPQNIPFNYIGFTLISPNYFARPEQTLQRKVYATSPITTPFPDITDQSSEEKLQNADALIAINYDTPSGNIKDARFIHSNTLIDFETVNLPENAVVTVLQSEETKPFNYKPGFYKAIVKAVPAISVKIGDETYKVQLTDPNGLSANAHYTFKVTFDTEKKTLSISHLNSVKWSDVNEDPV